MWRDEILKVSRFDRSISTKAYLQKAGYDIEVEANKLEKFYLESYNCVTQ